MKRRRHLAVLGATISILLGLIGAADAVGFGESAIPLRKGLAADCSAAAKLVPGSTEKVDWVVWCGPTHGRFEVEFGSPKGAQKPIVSPRIKVRGPGASGSPTCSKRGSKEVCPMRKDGPITVRGSLRVPGGACRRPIYIWITTDAFIGGEGLGSEPWGCPDRRPPRAPALAHIVRFYLQEDIGPALAGDRAAVVRKARQERAAWIDEVPTERWAAEAWGAPIGVAEAEELSLRLRMTQQGADTIQRWIHEQRLRSIFAGWYPGPEGDIYVGFTSEPEAMLVRMKEAIPFIAPGRVKPFPVPPRYTEGELENLMERVSDATLEVDEKTYGITDIGVEIEDNKVQVGARHPAATRRLLQEEFGAEAPIEVVKGEYAILV